MTITIGNLGRADKERAVLPAIVVAYDKSREGGITIKAFAIGIGWWKWGVKIVHAWRAS